MSEHRASGEGTRVNKPIYEIPVNGEPAGTSGAPSAEDPRLRPPMPPGSASVDYSQLPPPAVMPDGQPTPASTPNRAPEGGVPGSAPAPEGAVPGFTPAPGGEGGAIPGFTPAPGGDFAVPGFTPAGSFLPVPEFEAMPDIPLMPAPGRSARKEFVPDEHTEAARARVDADLLAALEHVVSVGASDLHVSAGAAPMVRVDGALQPVEGMTVWDRERVAAALYSVMTDEQTARFDEVLELDFAFTLSEDSRFRVNYYLQRGAVGAAFRLIPTEIKQLDQLGIPEAVSEFAKLPRGLVLVTGPTGSGKSTTLAALVDLVNQTRSDHIVTVEDPIEFMHQNKRSLVNQREVGNDTQSFANALKHVLRQDPDVILIGELRDLETISVALTAAETGHLVFATLHTQDAGQTIDRVIDVFPPHQQGQVRTQLAATLQGVVCQTLVKRAGGGRAVATEILRTTPAIANLVREGKTYQVRSALQAGRAQGMHTMDQHLADLVNSGQVAYGAALEKVHDLEDFKRLVHRTGDTDPANNAVFASRY